MTHGEAESAKAERERMAGEIHDTLAQGFLSIVALAQAAQVGETRERLDLIEATARAKTATPTTDTASATTIATALSTLASSPTGLQRYLTSNPG